MKYGIIIGNKPIQNKRPDGTKESTGSTLIEYKENEPVTIGKAVDGRVMKQVFASIPIDFETGYIIREECASPGSKVESTDILSVTGSIRICEKDISTRSGAAATVSFPLTASLQNFVDSQLYNYTGFLELYRSRLGSDVQQEMFFSNPIASVTVYPCTYRKWFTLNVDCYSIIRNLANFIESYRDDIDAELLDLYKDTYSNMRNAISVYLTITYLVKE